MIQTLAHISDLHVGRSAETDRAVARLRVAVADYDHVVVTGDVTHRGQRAEYERFEQLFGSLRRAGRLSVVPGNHDRLGDDVRAPLMRGGRVEIDTAPGVTLVRVDSTGPHNRFLLAGHGEIDERVLDDVDAALSRAPRDRVTIVMLHHHPLPLPEETLPERIATRLGWRWAQELLHGSELLARVRGRADLILHGHRHTPRAIGPLFRPARPLAVYNAGSTTALGNFRVFTHAAGALTGVRSVEFLARPARATLEVGT